MGNLVKDKVDNLGAIKEKNIDTIEKINGESLDIVKQNVLRLKEIFPEVFCEDKVDFERLQEVLGDYIENKEERYRFEWHGKSQAIRIAQTPSRGTFRPCKEESKNWDTTENIYIEGDNLEVLKLLQKSYQNKIKMIYIDPPYNTGNDFVYKDDYKDNLQNYLDITGQTDEEGNKTSTNSESSGRYHTNWLNMMYPRLRLARNLLTDDGVVFISIDDNENHNLRKVCDEIFGESNYIQEIVWHKKFSPQNDAKFFSLNHENIYCYAKNKELFKRNLLPMTDQQKSRYKNIDNDPRGVWTSGDMSVTTYSKLYDYPITTPNGNIINPPNGRCWRTSKEKFNELVNDNRIWFGIDGGNVPRIKRFLSETQQGVVPISLWSYTDVGHTQSASQDLKSLFNGQKLFDFPKPVGLIEKCMQIGTDSESLILDFFSGSSTTAEAVIRLNLKERSKRKFIMVQLPEGIKGQVQANEDEYKNICEIGKARIWKAGDKIVEENKDKEGIGDLDIGFKVFKLDSSNIKPWNPDYENLEMRLEDTINNFVPERTEEDVVYEIMLKYGIDLTYPIETREITGKKVFSIGFGALIICLDNEITLDVVQGMVDLKNELNPEISRFVFKDNGFKTDSVKTNAIEILKRNDIKDIMSI